ncbi:ABC transporter permease [Hyphococcus luteus]|uniref:Nitrate ABC transporter permease n=1 Tax=Hyphococcus luteus TaxID=2058213 RepID=A0A2S7K2A5_9PROT|nr:nitrate ABC transporter permease [Marinicaulis flavus]
MLQKAMNVFAVLGLGFINPFIRLVIGDNPKTQAAELWKMLGVPLLAIGLFLGAWSLGASQVETSLGQIPGPAAVWEQFDALMEDHKTMRAKEAAFNQRVAERNAQYIAAGQPDMVKDRAFTGKPTYIDQIVTSLKTVFFGFVIATLIAVPLGIFCGLSPTVNAAFNPLIQIFKPVSPLAWLPIVTMLVSALYVNTTEAMPKSFLISAITVTLCSLWPTLINTALGVSSIDKDLLNVSKVLQLKPADKIFKLVIPSSLPLIFTGLRLSLGVGWMVLIAAEMLAQNPGLGKFVWDEFQNGSSTSLARIMVAVLTIGVIGFLLDRIMYALQAMFTFSDKR